AGSFPLDQVWEAARMAGLADDLEALPAPAAVPAPAVAVEPIGPDPTSDGAVDDLGTDPLGPGLLRRASAGDEPDPARSGIDIA
ncbi:arginase family protein, partial [Micromonospora chalcea]